MKTKSKATINLYQKSSRFWNLKECDLKKLNKQTNTQNPLIINSLFVANVNNPAYAGGLTVMVYDNVAPASASNDVSVYSTVPEAVSSFWLIVAGRFVNVGTLLRSGKGEVRSELVGAEFPFLMLKYM